MVTHCYEVGSVLRCNLVLMGNHWVGRVGRPGHLIFVVSSLFLGREMIQSLEVKENTVSLCIVDTVSFLLAGEDSNTIFFNMSFFSSFFEIFLFEKCQI